jgi:hypothetical protein
MSPMVAAEEEAEAARRMALALRMVSGCRPVM